MGKLRVLDNEAPGHRIQCPSARPEMPGSVAFGVVLGSVEQPRVAFLDQPVPVTEELLALAQPVSPTEVFRFAAPCAGKACQHFDGASCRLATRIVQHLPEEQAPLPECTIRPSCRWWLQEGEDACRRCPLVSTESYGAAEITEPLRVAADPTTPV
ncbi:MAG TPA: nitrogen fixation protein [Thermoanaerobaculia bacterium]|nr:nitrogen fixation protein [Thermoanaerobaculia bacterium]